MSQPILQKAFVVAACLLAGACSAVGPDFERPDPELPAAYNADVPPILGSAPPTEEWWRLFDDRVLNELVARAREENLDIAVAASRRREATALARSVEGATGPRIDAFGEAGLTREFAGDSVDRETTGTIGGGLDALWEIDLFGGLFRSRQAAWADAEAARASLREASRLVTADLARRYVELRALEARLDLVRDALDLQERTLDLVRQRVTGGLAPGLDQTRAEAAVALLLADIGPLRSQIGQTRNAIAVLLGLPPGDLDEALARPMPVPSLDAGPAAGVPRDLVRRRPDLQAAEMALAAATADAGVRTAALYPRLTLPGSITIGRTGIGGEDVATNVVASIFSLVEIPVFDGGALRAQVDAAKERVVQATLTYRKTLLAAMEDVEASLLSYEGARTRREALSDAVRSNRQAFDRSRALYRQGFATFLDVLDSQRTLNSSQQEFAIAERDIALALIDLFSALGVGQSLDELIPS